ncbi:hypothetical protein L1887_50602 [Cichorium endivia]|nr:hypothetical protein L1887_50602 [Cichorium endivia]
MIVIKGSRSIRSECTWLVMQKTSERYTSVKSLAQMSSRTRDGSRRSVVPPFASPRNEHGAWCWLRHERPDLLDSEPNTSCIYALFVHVCIVCNTARSQCHCAGSCPTLFRALEALASSPHACLGLIHVVHLALAPHCLLAVHHDSNSLHSLSLSRVGLLAVADVDVHDAELRLTHLVVPVGGGADRADGAVVVGDGGDGDGGGGAEVAGSGGGGSDMGGVDRTAAGSLERHLIIVGDARVLAGGVHAGVSSQACRQKRALRSVPSRMSSYGRRARGASWKTRRYEQHSLSLCVTLSGPSPVPTELKSHRLWSASPVTRIACYPHRLLPASPVTRNLSAPNLRNRPPRRTGADRDLENRRGSVPPGGVEDDGEEASGDETGDGEGEDPGEEDPAEHPPVHGLVVSVAQADCERGTGDRLSGRDGQTEVGCDDDGDGSAELHGESTAWRVHGEPVAKHAHQLPAVRAETDDDSNTTECQDPDRNRLLGAGEFGGGPNGPYDGKGADGVGHIVGAVCKGGGAGGHDLHERVEVLDAVVVLFRNGVHLTQLGLLLLGTVSLHGVDIGAQTGGQTVPDPRNRVVAHDCVQVPRLEPAAVKLAVVGRGRTARNMVLVDLDRTAILKLGLEVRKARRVHLLRCGLVELGILFVAVAVCAVGSSVDLVSSACCRSGSRCSSRTVLLSHGRVGKVVNAVVRNSRVGSNGVGRSGTPPEQGAHEEVVPLERVVAAHPPWRTRRAARRGSKAEPPRRRCRAQQPQWSKAGARRETHHDRVLGLEHDVLGDEVHDGGETTGDSGGDTPRGKDLRNTVPAPLDPACAIDSDADANHRADGGVGGGDGHGVARGEREPGGGTDDGAREGEQEDRGVAVEDAEVDDAVLDGGSYARTHEHGAKELADGSGEHGLSEGKRLGRNRGGKRIGHIVGADTVRIDERADHRESKEVVVVVVLGHLVQASLSAWERMERGGE